MSDPRDLSSANPFPGLRPFEYDEYRLFFGRQGQSVEILRRLRRKKFVAVIGTSGSGKSSLIRAGLLPFLDGAMMADAGSHWRKAIFRPGNSPIKNLAGELAKPGVFGPAGRSDADPQDVLFLEAVLRASGLGLIDVVRQARLASHENVLIVVDQMEELFRFANTGEDQRREEEAAAFVKLLLEATRQSAFPIFVAITMRSDFIGDCARFQDLPETVNEGLYLIPRMTRDQRREAITGPVRARDVEMAPRLVNRLLNDVGDSPDQLPILQHALMRTWDYWAAHHSPREPIDLADYDAIGGMARALSLHADEAFQELPDARHREIARRMFQCLTEKGSDNREVRRPTCIVDLMAVTGASFPEILTVIECFRQPGRSFLTTPLKGDLGPESVIDISHESLIRGWDALRAWVDQEAHSAAVFRRLAQTAALHAERQAGLYHDPELQIALAWRDEEHPSAVWARRYHANFDQAMAFLESSRAARDAEQAAQEKSRLAKLRRSRLTIGVLAVASLVFLLLAIFAWKEKSTAQLATKAAENANVRLRAETKKANDNALAEAAAEKREGAALQDATTAKDDLQVEVLRSREELLKDQRELSNLADDSMRSSPPLARIETLERKGMALTRMGNHQAAIRQMTAMLEQDPQNLSALSGRAYEYILVGRPREAEADVRQYLAKNPNSEIELLNLAIARAMQGHYEEARQDVARAIRSHAPGNSNVFDSEVAPDIQVATGHKMLIANAPTYVVALWYELAVLHALEGDAQFQAALDRADLEAGRYPESIDPYLMALNWTWLHFQVRDSDYGALAASAALWLRAAKQQTRFHDWAGNSLVKFRDEHAKRKAPRYGPVADWVSAQLRKEFPHGVPKLPERRNSDPQEASMEAAELDARGTGDDLMRLAAMQRSLNEGIAQAEKDPKQRDVLVNLLVQRAKMRFRVEDNEGVIKDCHRILGLDKNNSVAYLYLARTDWDDARALQEYEAALRSSPTDTTIMWYFADSLYSKAHTEQETDKAASERDLRRALSLLETYTHIWPDSAWVYAREAKLCDAVRDPQKELESLNKAILLRPEETSYYEARRDAEKALKRDPIRAELHLTAGYREAGDALLRQGKNGQALAAFLKGLRTAAAIPSGRDNKDVRLEVEFAARHLTAFFEAVYSPEYALQFWSSLASSSEMKDFKEMVESEKARIQDSR